MGQRTGSERGTRLRRLDVGRLPDHRDRLFRAAYALCGSREDAEDLVQETFASVLKRPRFVRGEDDLAYLVKVMRNTWINMHRARARRPQTVPLDESTDLVLDASADPGVSRVELRAVLEAVRGLSPVLRDTVIAVDVIGLSYKQAARALAVREGTIMSRLYRGREQIAVALEDAARAPLPHSDPARPARSVPVPAEPRTTKGP